MGTLCSLVLSLALISTLLVSTVDAGKTRNAAKHSLKRSNVADPLYEFTGKLFTRLSSGKAKGSENVIISPISIHKALNMLLLGADANSTTKRELQDVIGYAHLTDDEVQKYHEHYASILTKFESITNKTRALNKTTHGAKEHEQKSPILDTFNMVITKNKGKVTPDYQRSVEKYYHSTAGSVLEAKSESALLDKVNAWGKGAGFGLPILSKSELNNMDAMLLSAIHLDAF